MQNNKVWFQSSVVWMNIALALVVFIQSISGIVPIPSGVIETVAIAGNFLLRFKTNTGLVSAQSQQ